MFQFNCDCRLRLFASCAVFALLGQRIPRVASPSTSSEDISRYHVSLELAHTILVQACLGVLLHSDGCSIHGSIGNNSPPARYAARHWVDHAHGENTSWRLRKAMEYLFDPHKPQFGAWLQLYDIDFRVKHSSPFFMFVDPPPESVATPLYYAALCGFHDLAKHLIDKHPQHINMH